MRRLPVVVIGVVVCVVVIAVVADRRSTPTESMVPGHVEPTEAAAPTVSATAPAPDSVGASAGQDDAVAAARRAGVAAVARTAEVFAAGFVTRRDLIAELATKRFAPTLADRTSQQVTDLLFGLRQETGREIDVSLVTQPMTATASLQSDGRVSVDVWTVAVYAASGSTTAPEQWLTVHLTMAWESSRWLVDDWQATVGPSPMPPSDGTFASAAEVAKVVAWPTAGTGGG
ncbi:MAG: hypothetical protein QM733_04560 [Ilumatobacteraceae bacterium]